MYPSVMTMVQSYTMRISILFPEYGEKLVEKLKFERTDCKFNVMNIFRSATDMSKLPFALSFNLYSNEFTLSASPM